MLLITAALSYWDPNALKDIPTFNYFNKIYYPKKSISGKKLNNS